MGKRIIVFRVQAPEDLKDSECIELIHASVDHRFLAEKKIHLQTTDAGTLVENWTLKYDKKDSSEKPEREVEQPKRDQPDSKKSFGAFIGSDWSQKLKSLAQQAKKMQWWKLYISFAGIVIGISFLISLVRNALGI